jgi:hypothetical protein
MFNITQDEMLAGLEHMEEQKLTHYDAHCPKCRRANRVERLRMERFFPDWKKAIKTMAKESKQAEVVSEKSDEASLAEKSSSPVKKQQPTGAKKK